MVRGLYSAASGALVAQSLAENVSNNLANASSNGFKQTLLQVESAPTLDIYHFQNDPGRVGGRAIPGVPKAVPVGALGTGSQVYDTPQDFTQGTLQETGNRLDVALSGQNGFFAVQTPQGVRYTRDGQFTLDGNGVLRTMDGNFVLGTSGRTIVVNRQQGPLTIEADGTIVQAPQAGQSSASVTNVGQLAIVGFRNLNAVRPEGGNNLADTGGAQPGPARGVTVQQGFLEKSNGNVVRSMVDLITAERWFEANQRMMKAQDDATNQAITQVAKTNVG